MSSDIPLEFSHFFHGLSVIASEAKQSTVTLPEIKTPAEGGRFLASLD
jgi:hypothetical protein